ncbi:MAG: anaerobic glycerol-3-phosphate dehydrogenase subunit GlpB [Chloroflexota bacterium]
MAEKRKAGRCTIDSTQGRGTDVIVIGAGLAGLLAAVHAVKAGARVRLIASGWGQQIVSPGWISVCDRAADDVIAEVRGHAALHPDHPYALAGPDALVCALDLFQDIAEEVGEPFVMRSRDGHNLRLATMLGAIQTPLLAPQGIAAGDLTEVGGPLLIVGFAGWRDFYPELVAGNLSAQGIAARALTLTLPAERGSWDDWPADLARRFDDSAFRTAVLRQIQPQIRDAVKVGFPAVLGMEGHAEVLREFEAALGCPVFEIPTLPPSPAGTRLSNGIRRWLLRQRARVQIGHAVVRGIVEGGRCTGVEVGALGHTNPFYADAFIVATGGLYNGGIQSDETGRLWEPIFGFPVSGPPGEGRTGWYGERLLVAEGHPIHRQSGLRVNTQMQPVDGEGAPLLENVFAAGHLLAGFNPLTDGCAEGVALATAYKAVCAALAAWA